MWNIKEFKNASILLTVLITSYISTQTYGPCFKASFIKCAIYFSKTKSAIKCIFKDIKFLLLGKLFPVKSYIQLVLSLMRKVGYTSLHTQRYEVCVIKIFMFSITSIFVTVANFWYDFKTEKMAKNFILHSCA